MKKRDHDTIKIEKKKERRTVGVSKMISEGGLGAEKYYDIEKDKSTEIEIDKQ